MSNFEVNKTVIRTRIADAGEEGNVVEIKGERARVYWPKRKRRTWVRFQDLKVKD
ncbi:hypothetical protein [Mucilaginibacter sp.]|uniref:hypothetical protein n=1 Tax=Mucilaginibacter sp. TaxID=1882438 RepID=UPI0026187B17|nr:hypothetical protein [Mucilaginibacter sp.]MDB4919474.1 hypothetical protein [Mucilaginibacter sp.]